MKAISKKFTALFLVFSVLVLSINLYAKERRGAELIITKKDRQQVEGELITVKPNSLLLLDSEGKDVSVNIEGINVIRIVKRSSTSGGAIVGFLIGGVVGIITLISSHTPLDEIEKRALIGGLFGGSLGLLVGIGIMKGSAGKDKTIQFEGMNESEIKKALDKLRKKARVRNYK